MTQASQTMSTDEYFKTDGLFLNGLSQTKNGLCPRPAPERVRVALAHAADLIASTLAARGVQFDEETHLKIEFTVKRRRDKSYIEA